VSILGLVHSRNWFSRIGLSRIGPSTHANGQILIFNVDETLYSPPWIFPPCILKYVILPTVKISDLKISLKQIVSQKWDAYRGIMLEKARFFSCNLNWLHPPPPSPLSYRIHSHYLLHRERWNTKMLGNPALVAGRRGRVGANKDHRKISLAPSSIIPSSTLYDPF